MTNEEALELVKGTERCFVVWATDCYGLGFVPRHTPEVLDETNRH